MVLKDDELADLRKKVVELDESVEVQEAHLLSKDDELADLRKKVAELDESVEVQEAQLVLKDEALTDLEDRHQGSVLDFLQFIADANQETEFVQAQLDSKRRELHDRVGDVNEIQQAKEDLAKVNQDLGTQLHQRIEETKNYQARIQHIQAENAELGTRTRDVQVVLADLEDKRTQETKHNQAHIHRIQKENAELSIKIRNAQAQLESRTLKHDAERTCLIDYLMSDGQDVRTFEGVRSGEKVVVRAILRESKAFVIIENDDGVRTIWHDGLENCTVEMIAWDWYVRLGTVKIRFDGFDPLNLVAFFKRPATVVASDKVN